MTRKRLKIIGLAAVIAAVAWLAWDVGPQKLATDILQGTIELIKFIVTGVSRWIWIGLGGAMGYAVGWFLSPQARAVRRLLLLITTALAFVVVFIADWSVAAPLTSLMATIAFVVGLGYWLGTATRGFFAKPDTFGSSEWATPAYLAAHSVMGDTGIRLGTVPTDTGPQPFHYAGDRHLLSAAPTRSGKGTGLIVPNLLTYRGSALVIDPKGENALITASQRASMGQDVHILDPWHVTRADIVARFNPLDWLELGDPDITENAMLLADALIVPDEKGDSFWTEEAKALLQGLILYVATDEQEAEDRHLGRVRDLLLLDGDDMPQLFQRMAQSLHHVVASTGARCLQKEDKLLANVLASAQAQTHFLDSPRLRDSLSSSDFRFEDLKAKPMTVYLVLPADRLNAFGRWLRLLIQQAITVNARNIEIRPERPVLFLLDEMPALGRLTMVEQAFGLMAGFGMQLWGIVQDLGQLKHIYGDRYEGFIANSGAITYFGSRDRLTSEYFSALCGETTVWNFSSAVARSVSSGTSSGGGNSSSSTSSTETQSWTQRKLAFPDELMRLRDDQQIVFIHNLHPIRGTKVRWFEDEALKDLGRDLHKEAGQ